MSMNKMQLEEGTFRKRPNASVLSHRRHRADSPWCSRSTSRAPVSIYMDGCFDMKHYGHCRDELIVGFISDDEIKANKKQNEKEASEKKYYDSKSFVNGE
ncbi:uncharacterized protein LOC120660781 isoform X2 [Panicum virgatum]|uniref:uncharacterized protein LOC120660781 isoform X2 n=1 Tax=Panicum virgatum TaxID=38727 RepID=UPI0019D58C2E|nr:uncharacterized protein LOC120660781 isoform X2 [Panicum virgatum]